jgi:hypothetical protein
MSTTFLEVLRVFLVVMGGLTIVWGVSDMFGDGQQSSAGVKKIVGGLAFASISFIIMTWSITNVKAAEAKAGITSAVNYIIPALINHIR